QVKMYLLDLTMNLKDLSEESRDKLQEAIIPMSIESDNESDERDYIFNSIPFAISISKARWLYVLNPENRRDAILSMMWDIAKALKIPEAQKRE
ncbi:MAG TPA: hypothetical protein VN132_16105, partial [Bdellovibrio sp.]|nr:hypothetical protein [Bdellovibrio sp.]